MTPPGSFRVPICIKSLESLVTQWLEALFFIKKKVYRNRHKKTRPAVARRADFCYNGRRQEVLAVPLASTREVSSHAPTVGLLYPFGGIKARVQTSQNGRIFYA